MTAFESVQFLRDAFERALQMAEELGAGEETLAGMRTLYGGQEKFMSRIESGEYDAATEAKVLVSVRDACVVMHEIAIEDSILVKVSDYFYDMLTRLRQWTLDAIKEGVTDDIKDVTPPPVVTVEDLDGYGPAVPLPGSEGDHLAPLPDGDVAPQAGVIPGLILEPVLLALAVGAAAYLYWYKARPRGYGARGRRSRRGRR